MIDYALDRREVFTRAYVQWVANKTKDPELLEAVRSRRLLEENNEVKQVPFFWNDEEFKPISMAMDSLFSKMSKTKPV